MKDVKDATGSPRPRPVLLAVTIIAALAGWSPQEPDQGPRIVTFASHDDLVITADLYMRSPDSTAPFIVLFHQAGWSRGEYLEIAPRLNDMGYNCMAVDLRSGKSVNGVLNETHLLAKADDRGTGYTDALPDVIAALEYAKARYGKSKLIAWGSSYSAALVLRAAGDDPKLVSGVVAFAPGEYFEREGKSKTWIRDAVAAIEVPVFITSAKREQQAWAEIYEAVGSPQKTAFVPETTGNHGSRALWSKFPDSEAYWAALKRFLDENFR